MTATAVDHVAVQLALRAVLVTLPELPTARAWDNVKYTPTIGQPYIVEQYVPSASTLLGMLATGPVEDTGLYVINWYGPAGIGIAMAHGVNALLGLFPPGRFLTATDGTVIRIRGDFAPRRGQILQVDPGWAVITATIPFRILT